MFGCQRGLESHSWKHCRNTVTHLTHEQACMCRHSRAGMHAQAFISRHACAGMHVQACMCRHSCPGMHWQEELVAQTAKSEGVVSRPPLCGQHPCGIYI